MQVILVVLMAVLRVVLQAEQVAAEWVLQAAAQMREVGVEVRALASALT